MDTILHDIHADRLDPDSFISTQDFDHKVSRIVETVAPLPAAVKSLEVKYDAVYTKFTTLFLSNFTATLAQLESELQTLVTYFTSPLENVVTTNRTVVETVDALDSHVSSLGTCLAQVESSLAAVATSTTTIITSIQDMGASLTSLLTRPPPGDTNPSPVTPARGPTDYAVGGSSATASGTP